MRNGQILFHCIVNPIASVARLENCCSQTLHPYWLSLNFFAKKTGQKSLMYTCKGEREVLYSKRLAAVIAARGIDAGGLNTIAHHNFGKNGENSFLPLHNSVRFCFDLSYKLSIQNNEVCRFKVVKYEKLQKV